MLSKKALFLITAENEVEALVEFAKVFKKKYGIEAEGLYVKDILKYEIFPIAVEGIGINVGANYAFKEYKELEEKTFILKKGEKHLENNFSEHSDLSIKLIIN